MSVFDFSAKLSLCCLQAEFCFCCGGSVCSHSREKCLDSFCVAQKVRIRATDSDEVEPQLGSFFGRRDEVKEECRAVATEEESLKGGRS